MRRREIQTPRPDYREKIERYGLSFHTIRGRPYWYESAAYRLDPAEVTVLQAATNELQERCLEAVEEVISRDWFDRLGVPLGAQGLIREVWELDPPQYMAASIFATTVRLPRSSWNTTPIPRHPYWKQRWSNGTGFRMSTQRPTSSTPFGRGLLRSGGT